MKKKWSKKDKRFFIMKYIFSNNIYFITLKNNNKKVYKNNKKDIVKTIKSQEKTYYNMVRNASNVESIPSKKNNNKKVYKKNKQINVYFNLVSVKISMTCSLSIICISIFLDWLKNNNAVNFFVIIGLSLLTLIAPIILFWVSAWNGDWDWETLTIVDDIIEKLDQESKSQD